MDFMATTCVPISRTRIADIGANPLTPPPYEGMRQADMCNLFGFEPQKEAFDALQTNARVGDRYFNVAIGTKGPATFHIYPHSGFSSLYKLCSKSLSGLTRFQRLPRRGRIVPVDLIPMDDVQGLPHVDMLKIDVQGAEFDIISGGRQRLSQAVCVIPELRYNRLYEGEPMMGDVDLELRSHGFTLHKFMGFSSTHLASSQSSRLKSRRIRSQLIDGDAVYIRALETMPEWTDRQLASLAQFAALVFGSHDLALQCLDQLVARGVLSSHVPERYVDLLPDNLRA